MFGFDFVLLCWPLTCLGFDELWLVLFTASLLIVGLLILVGLVWVLRFF